MKFVRPLYRDLYAWEEKRQQAIDTFKAHRQVHIDVAAAGAFVSVVDVVVALLLLLLLFLFPLLLCCFFLLFLFLLLLCCCCFNILSHRTQYMQMCADMVAKDLHLDEQP